MAVTQAFEIEVTPIPLSSSLEREEMAQLIYYWFLFALCLYGGLGTTCWRLVIIKLSKESCRKAEKRGDL